MSELQAQARLVVPEPAIQTLLAGRIDSTLSDKNVINIILNFENFSTIQFKMYYFLISILKI